MSNVVLIAKIDLCLARSAFQKVPAPHPSASTTFPTRNWTGWPRWGFTGLWLIGVWERSPASQKIKQIMGNPEAASSAYSLYDYIIAADLGRRGGLSATARAGLAARHPAGQRHGAQPHGHLLAMGRRTSRLVHPARLSPFPAYQFTGADLSRGSASRPPDRGRLLEPYATPRSSSSASTTGPATPRYIYHGNDGTSMPWNDTAQLNFLIPEVREAVIQTILHVARHVPDHPFRCRHDAGEEALPAPLVPATRRRRGDPVARRAWHDPRGIRRSSSPKEFWREVVDRVARGGARHAAAGRGVLADGRLFRPHPGHAPRLQQRLHEHAEDGGERQIPADHQERAGIQPRGPQALRQFHEQPRRADGRRAVRQGDKYFGVAVHDGHHARPADVRPRPDRRVHREIRHGIPPRLLG